MTIQKDFEKWLSECPVDYYQAFGDFIGNNTYMFHVPKEDDNEEDDDSN